MGGYNLPQFGFSNTLHLPISYAALCLFTPDLFFSLNSSANPTSTASDNSKYLPLILLGHFRDTNLYTTSHSFLLSSVIAGKLLVTEVII